MSNITLEVSKSMLKKYVELEIVNNVKCCGWIQSVDPLSKSFVLLNFDDSKRCPEIILIPGYNVRNIKIISKDLTLEEDEVLKNIFKKDEISYSKKEIEKRRESLSVWLADNRVPFLINQNLEIEVLQAALILPPYTASSIQCKNEVVLDKVIKLVTKAPNL